MSFFLKCLSSLCLFSHLSALYVFFLSHLSALYVFFLTSFSSLCLFFSSVLALYVFLHISQLFDVLFSHISQLFMPVFSHLSASYVFFLTSLSSLCLFWRNFNVCIFSELSHVLTYYFIIQRLTIAFRATCSNKETNFSLLFSAREEALLRR